MRARPSLASLFGSLRVRIAVLAVGLVALAAALGAAYTMERLSDSGSAAAHRTADMLALALQVAGTADELDDRAALEHRLRDMLVFERRLHAVRVTRGAASLGDAERMPTGTVASAQQTRRAALASYRRDQPVATRPPPGDLVLVERPLRDPSGRTLATIRFAIAAEARRLNDVRGFAAVAGGLAAALSLVIIGVVWRVVLVPLRGLRHAIAEIRAGRIGTRLGWVRADELGVLAEDFDAMAEELQQSQARLHALALRDPLTGLSNHRSFHEALAAAVERACGEERLLGVIALDLDHFKLINDTHGHPYGDEVLVATANALLASVRDGDLVARIGGEEFAIILPNADPGATLAAAERARASLAELMLPDGRSLSCSAGVATLPADATDAAALLRMADAALYEAKRMGRGRTCRYDAARTSPSAIEDQRAEIEAVLADPTALTMVFQPWVDLATGRIAGYEALARFPGSSPPNAWFAQAQRCGLGPELEALAVRRALERAPAPDGAFLSVNLSPSAVMSPMVQRSLPENLGRLVIEITEHEEIAESPALQDTLRRMRERGARIALDDAGAGYAGLEQLMRLRPDVIKLDRSLIRDVPDDLGTLALLEALVGFARRIDATVCAEGIETVDQLIALGDLDVAYGQGYGLARPATGWPAVADDVHRVLEERSVVGQPQVEEHDIGERRLEAACAMLSRAASHEQLRIALELVASELGADEAAVCGWDGRPFIETLSVTAGWAGCEPGERYMLRDYPLTDAVLREQQALQVLAGDPAADLAEREMLESSGFRSLLMLPAMTGSASVGLVEIARRSERPFTRSEVNRARVIAYQLGALLQSGRISAPTERQTVRYRGSRRLARTST